MLNSFSTVNIINMMLKNAFLQKDWTFEGQFLWSLDKQERCLRQGAGGLLGKHFYSNYDGSNTMWVS